MTVEHRYVIALNDIRAVVFECKNKECGARISVRPSTVLNANTLFECPSCHKHWLNSGVHRQDDLYDAPQLYLLQVLQACAKKEEQAGVRISFEFEYATTPA